MIYFQVPSLETKSTLTYSLIVLRNLLIHASNYSKYVYAHRNQQRISNNHLTQKGLKFSAAVPTLPVFSLNKTGDLKIPTPYICMGLNVCTLKCAINISKYRPWKCVFYLLKYYEFEFIYWH